jgi:hypothetical protein
MKHTNLTEGKTKGAGTNNIPTKPKPNNPPAPQPPKNITLKENEKLENKKNGKLTVTLDFCDWNNIIRHLEYGLQIVPRGSRDATIASMEELQGQLSNTNFYYQNSNKHRRLFPEQFNENVPTEEPLSNSEKPSSPTVDDPKVSWWKKLFKKGTK